MKRKKIISKILVGAMVFMSVTLAGIASVKAGNIQDHVFSFSFIQVNDRHALTSRAKNDYTSIIMDQYMASMQKFGLLIEYLSMVIPIA